MSSSISSYSSPGEAVASIEGPRSLIMSFAHNPTLASCSTVNFAFRYIARHALRERDESQVLQKREECASVLKEKIRILEILRKLAKEAQFEMPPFEGDIDTQYASALTFIRANRVILVERNILQAFLQIDFREEQALVLQKKLRILEALRELAEDAQFEMPLLDGDDIDTQYATALTFIRANRAQLIDFDILLAFLQIDFTDGINLFFDPGFNLTNEQRNVLFGHAVQFQNLDVINRLLEQPAILSNETISFALDAFDYEKPKTVEMLLSMILSCGDRFTNEQLGWIVLLCAEGNEIRIIRILLFGLTKERILSEDRNYNLILHAMATIGARSGSIEVLRAVFELEDRMPPNDPETDHFQTAYIAAIQGGFSEAVALLTPYMKNENYRDQLMFKLRKSVEDGKLESTRNLLNHIKNFRKTEAGDLLYAAAKSGNTEVLQEIISRFRDQISQEWVKATIQDRIKHSPLPIIKMLLSLLQGLDPDEDDVFASTALSKTLQREAKSVEHIKEQNAIILMLISTGRIVFTNEFLRNFKDKILNPWDTAEKEILYIIIDKLQSQDRTNARFQELYDAALERGDDKRAHELMLEYRDHNY